MLVSFCWQYKQTDCRPCSIDTNVWSDESHAGKVTDNITGLRIMACKFEGLVTGLFPSEMSRAGLIPSGVQTTRAWRAPYIVIPSDPPVVEDWCVLGRGWKMWVSLLCSWFSESLQVPPKHSIPTAIGVWYWLRAFPCQKTSKKCYPENYPRTVFLLLQHLNSWLVAMLFIQNNLGWNSFDWIQIATSAGATRRLLSTLASSMG